MKKNDIGLIVVVAIFAGIFSLIASNIIFTPKNTKELTAQRIDQVQSDFIQPDKRFFNENSINPTQLIQIGGDPNKQPF